MLKALSIRQPWSWLIINQMKDVENRSWQTKYRGQFIVHAGAKVDKNAYEWLSDRGVKLPPIHELTTSAFLGTAVLLECVTAPEGKLISPWADDSGFCFVLDTDKTLAFDSPIPGPGALGFFSPSPEIIFPQNVNFES